MTHDSRPFAAIGPVSATIEVKPEDFREFGGHIPRKRLISILLFVVILALFIAIINYSWLHYAVHQGLLVGWNISRGSAGRVDLALANDEVFLTLLIIGAIYLTYYAGYRAGLRRILKRVQAARGEVPVRAEIALDSNGLHVRDAYITGDYGWADVSGVIETKRLFSIALLGSSAMIVPKRDLDPAFVAALEQARTALQARDKARAAKR